MEESGCRQEAVQTLSSQRTSPATASSGQLASLFDDLRKHYALSDKPPFATDIKWTVGHRPGDVRKLVLATDDGQYPQANVQRLDLVVRRWNKRCVFCTIEVDGSLHIIKCIVGGLSTRKSGEAAFKHWQHPQHRFSELPIAFEDRDIIKTGIENHQMPSSAWSTVPAARSPTSKKILRASKPLGHSQTNKDGRSYDPPPKHACSSEAMFAGEISSSDSSSSPDDDEARSSLDASQANPSKHRGVKTDPDESCMVSTPATAVSRVFSSPPRVTSQHTGTLDPRPQVDSLQEDDVDKLLVQLKDDGKSFTAIKQHFSEVIGLQCSRSAWYFRYKHIIGEEATPVKKNTEHSERNTSLKRSRQPTDADPRPQRAKRACRISQLAQPPSNPQAASTTRADTQHLHTPHASPQVAAGKLLSLAPETREAEKMLLRMRDVQHESWPVIQEAWTAMTGQETAPGTLPSRYRRLKARLKRAKTAVPAPTSSIPVKKRRVHQHESTPVANALPKPVTRPATSSMPTLASHKLNRTTLRISHSGSFTPLKLRSCKTISELFDAVASICDLNQAAHRKNIGTLKATFSWIPASDSSRTMLLKEGFEDSFEFLLETIDEAPCWKIEDGKCTVHIEVVHRNITGEPAGEGSIGSWPVTDVAYTRLLRRGGA